MTILHKYPEEGHPTLLFLLPAFLNQRDLLSLTTVTRAIMAESAIRHIFVEVPGPVQGSHYLEKLPRRVFHTQQSQYFLWAKGSASLGCSKLEAGTQEHL